MLLLASLLSAGHSQNIGLFADYLEIFSGAQFGEASRDELPNRVYSVGLTLLLGAMQHFSPLLTHWLTIHDRDIYLHDIGVIVNREKEGRKAGIVALYI